MSSADGATVTFQGYGKISPDPADNVPFYTNPASLYDSNANLKIEGNFIFDGFYPALVNYNNSTVTLTNAEFTHNVGFNGGAIGNNSGCTVTISGNANFNGNNATNGGAIYNLEGAVSVAGPANFEDTATTNGGAIYNYENGTINLYGKANFSGNEATNGGAIYNNENSTINLSGDAVFTNNIATNDGGAIYNYKNSTINLSGDAKFNGNTATNGGAIYNTENSTINLSGDAVFTNNIATSNGGAIYNRDTVTLAGNALFSGNKASGANGAANSIHLNDGSTLLLTGGAGTVVDMRDPMSSDGSGVKTITKSGGGLWKLAGNNALNGGSGTNLTVSAGTLELYKKDEVIAVATAINLGSGTFTLGSSATLTVAGADNEIKATTITFADNSNITGSGSLTLTGTQKLDGNLNVGVVVASELMLNTAFTDGVSAGALTKTGVGTLILTGANTYTGATNFNGGTVDLTGTGGLASAAFNFNGGLLTGVTDTNVAVTTAYTFNLTRYRAANSAAASIVKASTGADLTGASFHFTGGSRNEYYLFDKVDTGGDAAVAAIGEYKSLTRVYRAEYDGAGSWLKLFVTTNSNNLKDAALADSSSNGGIADALTDNFDDLPDGIAEALDAITDFGELGAAITQLNGANSTSAAVALANHATIQDQAAYGEYVGENATARAALEHVNMGNLGGRASLGGKSANKNFPLRRGGNREAVDGAVSGLTGFVKAYGGFGANKSTHAATGYDFGGVGLISGLGYKFSRELELGALIGYSYNHSELYRHFGEVTDNVVRLGAFGNYTFDNFYFNTAPTFGIHLLSTERYLDFMHATAKADRTGFDFSWYNRFGYTFELPQKFFITPSYALGMAYLHNPSYTETGAAAALKVNAYDNWSLTQNLEVRVGKLFQVNDRFALLPEIWGGWEHEYLSANDVTMRFAAAQNVAWSAPVTRLADDRTVFVAGITTLISNKYEVFGRYNQRLWDGGNSATFTVGVGVKF